MAVVLPVTNDKFIYNGDLYVNVGNLNHHKRATVAEITGILRPNLKKSKNPTPIKDQVGHWYEAQLIHYGLPLSNNKATAKMRLLDALNSSKLKVPESINVIESELKKQYAASERKAKAQLKKEMATGVSSPAKPSASRKRKQPDTASNAPSFNVNINFGTGAASFSESSMRNMTVSSNEPTPRKRQTASRGRAKAVPAPALSRSQFQTESSSTVEKKQYATKQTARRGRAVPSFLFDQHSGSDEGSDYSYEVIDNGSPHFPPASPANPKKKQKMGDEPSVKKEAKPPPAKPRIKKEVNAKTATLKAEPKIKKEQAPKTVKPKAEPKVKKEQSSRSVIPPNQSQQVRQKSNFPFSPSLGLINGIYDLECPELAANFGDDDFTLTLTLDSPGVWAAYDFGQFSGIMRLSERPWAAGDTCFFYWRGREHGEGEMSFGDYCHGEITFGGDGGVQGGMNLFGGCTFHGFRRPGPGTPGRTAASMRMEWEEYCEENYERERVGRWR